MRELVLLLLLGATVAAQDESARGALAVEPLAPDEARDARIAELIGELPAIGEPWYGITDTSGGGIAFDAVEARDIVPNALRDLPRSGPPHAFRELVRLGPAAIPALLEHLEDKRATKLSFKREQGGFGGMFEWSALFAGCPAERALIVRVLGAKGVTNPPDELERDIPFDKVIREHAVTVGDCCFAIVGQIVNRPYEAVRYQPTMITIVTSPARDPRIAEVLRAWWGRGDPRQILARSLYQDLRSRDCEWTGAVLRLFTYFPGEAGATVAPRIARVSWGDIGSHERSVELLRVAMSTGDPLVRAEWLKLLDPARPVEAQLAALATAPPDPGEDARARIRTIRDECGNVDLVAARIKVLPGEPSGKAFACLKTALAAAEKRDPRRTQVILAAMARLDEEESLPIFRAHIEKLERWGRGGGTCSPPLRRRPGLRWPPRCSRACSR